jgi:hypothetical protein
MFRATVAAGFGLCAMLGVAGAQPVLDVGAVPNLTAQARASYAIFLRMNLPPAVSAADSLAARTMRFSCLVPPASSTR